MASSFCIVSGPSTFFCKPFSTQPTCHRLPPSTLSISRRCMTVTRAAAASTNPTTGKSEPKGIRKPRPVSPEMQELVGAPEIPRTQALKLIWAYIKENNLQDPENKKVIVCDEKLKKIFAGKDRVGFLEIAERCDQETLSTIAAKISLRASSRLSDIQNTMDVFPRMHTCPYVMGQVPLNNGDD
ncbi:hypothetical protein ACFE04_022155 [Oxalis oulophora]